MRAPTKDRLAGAMAAINSPPPAKRPLDGWKFTRTLNGHNIVVNSPGGQSVLCRPAEEAGTVREALLHQLCSALMAMAELKAEAPAPERQPMTISQINALPEARGWWPSGDAGRITRLLRAVERFHGIGAGPAFTPPRACDSPTLCEAAKQCCGLYGTEVLCTREGER